MVGIVVMIGESVYIYALVGISAKSGYRRSDNRRSGKRRSDEICQICVLIVVKLVKFV